MSSKLAVVGLVAFLGGSATGYSIAPREILDSEVEQAGIFTTDTKQVLSATVTSLRSENRLVVYSYSGDVRVRWERSRLFGAIKGTQELFVPAKVNYLLNLGELKQTDVIYDEASKRVRIKLPMLKMGDIAFQPERATTINGGPLTYSDAEVQELSKKNYANARKALVKQAQQPSIVIYARKQAEENVAKYFEIPLKTVGHNDITVEARFEE